ncbi:hypothetical protein [Ralstonia pseudosolanacearum]|nr:hypothetical protein [Ralstonia sp. RS647]
MSLQTPQPARYLHADDFKRYVPVHVVWEITLAWAVSRVKCNV